MKRLIVMAASSTLAFAPVAPAIAATPAGKAHPPVAIGSVGEWFGADAYPPDAMQANEEGRVVVRLTVDADGRPVSCLVATSSGSYALDSGTCDIAMAHLLFRPATDADGHVIGGVFPMTVRWVIPKDPPPTTAAHR